MNKEGTICRLRSNRSINAPGLMLWLRRVALTDRPMAERLLGEGYPGIPYIAVQNVLNGSYSLDGDTVEVNGFVLANAKEA